MPHTPWEPWLAVEHALHSEATVVGADDEQCEILNDDNQDAPHEDPGAEASDPPQEQAANQNLDATSCDSHPQQPANPSGAKKASSSQLP